MKKYSERSKKNFPQKREKDTSIENPSAEFSIIVQYFFYLDTVISMIDVLYGLFLTKYDDILEYAIIFMGYLCYCVTEE